MGLQADAAGEYLQPTDHRVGRGTLTAGGEAIDFRKTHLEPLYSYFSGSADRLAQTRACLADAKNAADLMRALRQHREDVQNPLAQGSVASPLHACRRNGRRP